MQATAKSFSLTALVAGALLALAGCAKTISEPVPSAPVAQAPSAPAAPDTSGPVLVGLLAPISTSDEGAARLADALVNSARLALADAGQSRMRLEIYDTGGTPDRAASAARDAIADGAKMIVGPLFAESTRAVAPIAGAAGINVISFSTDRSVAGDPVYLSGYLPEAEARRVAAFASRRALRDIAVYYPQTPYGEAAWQGIREAANRANLRIVASQSYPRSFQGIQQSAAAFAEEAREAGTQAVLLADGGQGLRSVGAFLSYAGLSSGHAQYLGLGQWNSPITLEEPALRGGVFPAPDPERVRAFLSRYGTQFGSRPPVLAVLGYDAVALAAQMLESGEPGALSDSMLTRPGGWSGVFGPVRFFPDGTSERGMAILRVEDNGFDVLEPAPRSFGAGL